MNWHNLLTYGNSQNKAFETLCNQLFERYLRRQHKNNLTKFRVINGAGGDGGIEAYGELQSGGIVAVQAKWFPQSLDDGEIGQIRNSIKTALNLRPNISEYIICIPHNVNSLKIGRGKIPTTNHEEAKINGLIDEIFIDFPQLKLTWWFENEILTELQKPDNEGVNKYWFSKETISIDELTQLFQRQKRGWLSQRYIPELHGQGLIFKAYQELCFSQPYREKQNTYIQDVIERIGYCNNLIEQFILTNQNLPYLNARLKVIHKNLLSFKEEYVRISDAIRDGNDVYQAKHIKEVWIWYTMLKLQEIKPNNLQKNILKKLIASLENIHQIHLEEYIVDAGNYSKQSIRLVTGAAGTGKTHGLSNVVEEHLGQNSPAFIIQAKGCPCSSWTEILNHTLELTGWRQNEIFSALESVALRNDADRAFNLSSGEELKVENTRVIICVDGLEEDFEKGEIWYERIRECEYITSLFPRIRFIFSARDYFYNNQQIPQAPIFDSIHIPRGGDISVFEIADKYFEHYNITLASPGIIKGLDSLLALRLFCEEYGGKTLSTSDSISTAVGDLLNLKIDKANQDFLSKSLKRKVGSSRKPVLEGLTTISNSFYFNPEIEYNELVEKLRPTVGTYLETREIDLLIDYLADNGFLVKSIIEEKVGILKSSKSFYYISYQSIIEHIISERVVEEIIARKLNHIPKLLFKKMILPRDYELPDITSVPIEKLPNEKIIQNIVNTVFINTGLLIGENDFLSTGFSKEYIFELQMEAIMSAPSELALKYKAMVDDAFLGNYKDRYRVLTSLIIPSCSSSNSVFGANYLHNILISQPNAFARDKIWSGLDKFDTRNFDFEKRLEVEQGQLDFIIDEVGLRMPYLSDLYEHDEKPLLYAWALTTIDQELRQKLRTELCAWATKRPFEFLKLLDKIFICNDPQIQEDMASITLGLATNLRDEDAIREIGQWVIENVFSNVSQYRNVIVRLGFRAIVEKAHQLGLLTDVEVEHCRPRPTGEFQLLPLDVDALKSTTLEVYPIVHDLSWYVIDDAYNDFLELPFGGDGKPQDRDCPQGKELLDKYRAHYQDENLFASRWTLSAAIAYMKSLGFDRVEGNWHTDATHGSKSKVFTYEEKYTWLAVHYLMGYLSDYVPMKYHSGFREFIKDYSEIVSIHNPAEITNPSSEDTVNEIRDSLNETLDEWLIKESLCPEIEGTDIKQSISIAVNKEPQIDFSKWILFEPEDIIHTGSNKIWLATHNYTGLHDSNEYCFTYIKIESCLVKKDFVKELKDIIESDPDSLYFIDHLEMLEARPQTDTYSNPKDIVGQKWTGEEENEFDFGNEGENKMLYSTTTKVVQRVLDNEKSIYIPSKMLRELLGCTELGRNFFKNQKGEVVAIKHEKSDGFYRDGQNLVLVDKELVKGRLHEEGLEIIWFVEHFKHRNPLNKDLDDGFHPRKTRKYFVWLENENFMSYKFWDEQASNVRDKDFIEDE